MIVTIKAIGDLRTYFGRQSRQVELPAGATARDLCQRIEQIWGTGLPAYLWDFASHQFRGPVMLVVNKKAILNIDAPLQDGMEISILHALAGG